MTIGEVVAMLRRSKGMSQGELSKTTRMPIGTIRYHERSRREMTAIALFKYANALNVNPLVFVNCKPIKKRK